MTEGIHMKCLVAAAAALALCTPLTVTATSQRTFVASGGSDANPCSLALPCRSFGAAIAQTSTGGEVVVLDSAGYGQIASITQSIAIVAPEGVYAGISVMAGDGVTINGAGIQVVLRGLTLNGQGGGHGIAITNADSVYVDRCVIANTYGSGIYQLAGKLYVNDTIIRGNGVYGVYVQGPAKAQLDRVRLEANGSGLVAWNGAQVWLHDSLSIGHGNRGVFSYVSSGSTTSVIIRRSLVAQNWVGVEVQSAGSGLTAQADVTDSEISGSAQFGVYVYQSSGGIATIAMARTNVAKNAIGIDLAAGGTSATLDDTLITQNTTGVFSVAGSTVYSRMNNTIRDNTTATSGASAGAPTSVVAY